ncbi:MAG: hypothetical protein GY786_15005 [Proteobacteria bacterium]|nr:hypothetical protein [Pseudomonadota bacterium]
MSDIKLFQISSDKAEELQGTRGAIELEAGFTRDVRSIGHFGTGDLEVTISSAHELERAKSLIQKSFESS